MFDDTIAGQHVLLVGFEGMKPADDFLVVQDGFDTMIFATELSNVDLFMACTSPAGIIWDRFETWRDAYRDELE